MSEIIADTAQIPELEDQLDALDRHGFLLVRDALARGNRAGLAGVLGAEVRAAGMGH